MAKGTIERSKPADVATSNNSSAAASASDQTGAGALQQDGATTTTVVKSDPSGVNGPGGTNTSAADGQSEQHEAGGHAANPPADLAAALSMTGCTTFDNLVDMANVGRDLLEAINARQVMFGPLEGLAPIESPVEIVGALVDLVDGLQQQLEALKAKPPASFSPEKVAEIRQQVLGIPSPEKRSFAVLNRVRLDNVLIHPGGAPVRITKSEHGQLAKAGAVDPDWDEGF